MSASAKPSFPSEIFRGVIENDALRAEINLLQVGNRGAQKEISPARSSAILVGSDRPARNAKRFEWREDIEA